MTNISFESHVCQNITGPKKRGVSLIFVDRVLDLCTPTSNNTESLLSRIFCTLPPLPDHHNDVAIDMSPLFQSLQVILIS